MSCEIWLSFQILNYELGTVLWGYLENLSTWVRFRVLGT